MELFSVKLLWRCLINLRAKRITCVIKNFRVNTSIYSLKEGNTILQSDYNLSELVSQLLPKCETNRFTINLDLLIPTMV